MESNRNADKSLADTYGLDSTSFRGSEMKLGIKQCKSRCPMTFPRMSFPCLHAPNKDRIFSRKGREFHLPPDMEAAEGWANWMREIDRNGGMEFLCEQIKK